jgi:hypothetical protein
MSNASQAARESPGTQQGQPDDAGQIAESCQVPERFGGLFDRHATAIHGYIARRLGRDAADDLVAETFLVAFCQQLILNPKTYDLMGQQGFDTEQRRFSGPRHVRYGTAILKRALVSGPGVQS